MFKIREVNVQKEKRKRKRKSKKEEMTPLICWPHQVLLNQNGLSFRKSA